MGNIANIITNQIDEAKNIYVKFQMTLHYLRGIKESNLIAYPIHTLNQELDEIVIKVPRNIEKKSPVVRY